jgi:DNA-directed RNA polymerase subunit F
LYDDEIRGKTRKIIYKIIRKFNSTNVPVGQKRIDNDILDWAVFSVDELQNLIAEIKPVEEPQEQTISVIEERKDSNELADKINEMFQEYLVASESILNTHRE